METTLQQINYYLKNYHQDLTDQLESGGIDKVNFCCESTPYFDEDSEAREYIVNLAIIIDKMEGLK
tara:strand:- start:236 stop:433 length:198 start_codon:yes stop_codon:yes gene_type:complete